MAAVEAVVVKTNISPAGLIPSSRRLSRCKCLNLTASTWRLKRLPCCILHLGYGSKESIGV